MAKKKKSVLHQVIDPKVMLLAVLAAMLMGGVLNVLIRSERAQQAEISTPSQVMGVYQSK